MRYVVRREFFGALVYDCQEDTNIIVDDDFWTALQMIAQEGDRQLEEDSLVFLMEEGFLNEDYTINYRLINSGSHGETLSAPGRVHFYYTKACNLNCTHCFTKNSNPKYEMTYAEKISMLDQMHELGVNEILIGGGEPFIQKDFPNFVEESLKRGIVTKVFTNGLLLDDTLIARMKNWNLKYMSISIDGCTEEEYEFVRGVKGLEKLSETVKKLRKECQFTVAASVTVNSHNFENADKILKLIADMGFQRLKIRPVKPAGNVYQHPEVFPSAEQYVTFIKTAQRIWNQKYKDMFTLDFSWGDTRLIYREDRNIVDVLDITYPYEGYGCFAGKVNIVIDSGGNALTCGFLPDKYNLSASDNLRNKGLKKVWESGQCFCSLRNLPGNTVCKGCQYYPICRGGCMARNLFFGLNINQVDPWCLRRYFPIQLEE